MKLRPDAPKVYDITPDGYHEHNRYFNQAEKVFDRLEKHFYPEGYEDCALCRDCGRVVHDYHIPNEIWNDVITGSSIIYLSDGVTPSKEGAGGVWCYDCFCERASKKGYVAVFRCELIHHRKKKND